MPRFTEACEGSTLKCKLKDMDYNHLMEGLTSDEIHVVISAIEKLFEYENATTPSKKSPDVKTVILYMDTGFMERFEVPEKDIEELKNWMRRGIFSSETWVFERDHSEYVVYRGHVAIMEVKE